MKGNWRACHQPWGRTKSPSVSICIYNLIIIHLAHSGLALRRVAWSSVDISANSANSTGKIPDLWFLVSLYRLKLAGMPQKLTFHATVFEPGALGRFIGMLVAITPAAFSMSGIELISM